MLGKRKAKERCCRVPGTAKPLVWHDRCAVLERSRAYHLGAGLAGQARFRASLVKVATGEGGGHR